MLRYIVTKLAFNLLRMGKELDHDQPWETDDTDTLVDKLDRNRLEVFDPYPEIDPWETSSETWTPIRDTQLIARSLELYAKHGKALVMWSAFYAIPSLGLALLQPESVTQNRVVFWILFFLTLGGVAKGIEAVRKGE